MLECIPLEKLIEMWQGDAVINKTEPSQEIIRVPVLHSKYASQIAAHTISLKMKRFEFAKAKKFKIDYFSGRLNGTDELKKKGLENFQFVLKTDLNIYLES